MLTFRLSFLAGPLAVRDVVVGSLALTTCLAGFLLGCAFVSLSNLVWFAFVGLLGAIASLSGLQAFAAAHRLIICGHPVETHELDRAAA